MEKKYRSFNVMLKRVNLDSFIQKVESKEIYPNLSFYLCGICLEYLEGLFSQIIHHEVGETIDPNPFDVYLEDYGATLQWAPRILRTSDRAQRILQSIARRQAMGGEIISDDRGLLQKLHLEAEIHEKL